jgi:hypothetical protein
VTARSRSGVAARRRDGAMIRPRIGPGVWPVGSGLRNFPTNKIFPPPFHRILR